MIRQSTREKLRKCTQGNLCSAKRIIMCDDNGIEICTFLSIGYVAEALKITRSQLGWYFLPQHAGKSKNGVTLKYHESNSH